MTLQTKRHFFFIFWMLLASFLFQTPSVMAQNEAKTPLRTGAERMEQYLQLLEGRRVGLVINQTSVVHDASRQHFVALPDTLLRRQIDVRCIMAPEHGYKGTAEAGAHIQNGRDEETGLTIYSLYGKDKKPRKEWMDEVDVLIFDIQDVGCRFYTYLSTLYYVMQACAENDKPLIVLDRPNPKDTIDGPMLRPGFESFVGIVPVPILHGCTLGEMAQMIDGERWCPYPTPTSRLKLTIITCEGWQHGEPYSLPIAPSKNLCNDHAIALYPSLCLFEGSEVSVGRGTDHPFEMFGNHDLRQATAPRGFGLDFYLQYQREKGWGWITRAKFFNMLAGSDELYSQLKKGWSEQRIRASWQEDLTKYRAKREKYQLY